MQKFIVDLSVNRSYFYSHDISSNLIWKNSNLYPRMHHFLKYNLEIFLPQCRKWMMSIFDYIKTGEKIQFFYYIYDPNEIYSVWRMKSHPSLRRLIFSWKETALIWLQFFNLIRLYIYVIELLQKKYQGLEILFFLFFSTILIRISFFEQGKQFFFKIQETR